VFLDRDEAIRRVQIARWIVLRNAETYGWVSLSNAGLDEVNEEPTSDPLVPAGRDDCDRQFGDILGDEAMAMARLRERPIPSRAQRSILFGNQSIVSLPRPSCEIHRVARIGEHLVSGRCRLVRAPDGGLAEHRREKGVVLGLGRANPNVFHLGQSSSSAICVRTIFDFFAATFPARASPYLPMGAAASARDAPAGNRRSPAIVMQT